MIYAVIILAAVLIVSAGYLFLIKKDLKNIRNQLLDLQKTDTNAQLTTATFDTDICALATAVNDMLAKYKAEAFEYSSTESKMKQAITNISHDLRTPLTSALGYLQLLESKEISDVKQREYTKIVQTKLNTLSSRTEHLFEFTQVFESQNLKRKEINICNVLRDVLAGFYDDFVQKGFDVRLEIPDTPVSIMADQEAVNRIFQNLVQNALIHGIQCFMVRLDPQTREIEFVNRVNDIKTVEIEHIFDRFYTFDASRTNKNTGLGLAIVKSLVDRMDGSISAGIKGDSLHLKLSF